MLILGGKTDYGDGSYSWPKTGELFDPDSGTFSVMDHLDYGLEEPKLALEPDCGVLVMGTVKDLLAAQQSIQKYMGLANREFSSASPVLALNSVLVAQVAPQDRSELHPLEAALKTATTSYLAGCSLAGQRPTLARISIPLPDNADLTAGTQPLPIGTNSNAAYLLLKSIRPNLPGITLRGYSVVLEVVNDITRAVDYQKVMVGGGTPDNPTPLSLAQAQQSGLFQRVQSQADIPIPNQLTAATLQDYVQREPFQDERRLTPQEKELLYKHRKSWTILGWTRSMLPATPENNPNRAFYKVQIDFSSNNGIRQNVIPYGLSALGISFPNEGWSFRYRVKAHYDQEVASFTVQNEVFKPLWSVAQLFRDWFVPSWDNDKWVSPELFRWLFQRSPVGEFSNRDLLEPANDFTLEHGHNESHKGHFAGNEADTYHPGYQAFTHSDARNGTGGDFRDSYLIPYLQIARGDLVNPEITRAHATQVLIDWISRARSRIFGLMTQSRKEEYGPDSFIYMCRNSTSTNLDIKDCHQLRRLLLVGECDPYSVDGTSYQGLNLVSSVGVWVVEESKWTGLTDTSHTDHFHCKWAKKETKFNPNGTQEN